MEEEGDYVEAFLFVIILHLSLYQGDEFLIFHVLSLRNAVYSKIYSY